MTPFRDCLLPVLGQHSDVPLELGQCFIHQALVFFYSRSGEVVFDRVPLGSHSISRSNPLTCHSAVTPPRQVGTMPVGGIVLSSSAIVSSQSSRAAAASGWGGVLPSGRFVSNQGRRAMAAVVGPSHLIPGPPVSPGLSRGTALKVKDTLLPVMAFSAKLLSTSSGTERWGAAACPVLP